MVVQSAAQIVHHPLADRRHRQALSVRTDCIQQSDHDYRHNSEIKQFRPPSAKRRGQPHGNPMFQRFSYEYVINGNFYRNRLKNIGQDTAKRGSESYKQGFPVRYEQPYHADLPFTLNGRQLFSTIVAWHVS